MTGEQYKQLPELKIRTKTWPWQELKQLGELGITPAQNQFPETQPAVLLELENKEGNEYWLGFKNFFVITRYNLSALYAMAVYQLSEEIMAQRNRISAQAEVDVTDTSRL